MAQLSAGLPSSRNVRFLYLWHTDIEPDLISHEIAPPTFMALLDLEKKFD